MAQPGNFALDGGDPRLHQSEHEKVDEKGDMSMTKSSPTPGGVSPHARGGPNDPNVTFEEYYYYAQQTRAEEAAQPVTGRETTWLSLVFPSKSDGGVVKHEPSSGNGLISDAEWADASRALRTATRGAAFYLITTDILGPFGLPYAFATMGWG
jgi:hypothetical protein